MSDANTPPALTDAERARVDELIANLNEATACVMREAKRMERNRIRLGYGALAVAGIAFGGLCIARDATQFVICGMQFLLFAGSAFAMFHSPRIPEGDKP